MPYVDVYVDAAEVLSDISDDDLRKELESRRHIGGGSRFPFDHSIPAGEARAALAEAATFFRKAGRLDLAFKLDEIAEDYVGIPTPMRVASKDPIATLPGHKDAAA